MTTPAPREAVAQDPKGQQRPSQRRPGERKCLSFIFIEQIRASYDPTEMTSLGIYPETAWSEPETEDALVEIFVEIKKLFSKAVEKRCSILVQIVV